MQKNKRKLSGFSSFWKNTAHPKTGMWCTMGGTGYIMTEELACFSLMKNELLCFEQVSERQAGPFPFSRHCQGQLRQQEGERTMTFTAFSCIPVLVNL